MSDGNSTICDPGSGPDGMSAGENTLSPDATLTWTISALRVQSRGFLHAEQFISVMGLGAPRSSSERDANLDRVVSKFDRVLETLGKRRMPRVRTSVTGTSQSSRFSQAE